MAKRRKFLIGVGSLVAGAAAATGTGAFTSVSAERGFQVRSTHESDALLSMQPEDTPNGRAYVDTSQYVGHISIDLGSGKNQIGDEGAYGVNGDAYTVIRNLFQITNKGTQNVYVWAEGLPSHIRMFHDDDGSFENAGTGAGENQGAFSDSSNLFLDDIDDNDDNDGNNGKEEAAPLLAPGDTLNNVGLLVDTRNGGHFDGDVVIKAVAEDEVN
jgi:hypothetical protein